MAILVEEKIRKIGAPKILSPNYQKKQSDNLLQESINKSAINIMKIKENIKKSKKL